MAALLKRVDEDLEQLYSSTAALIQDKPRYASLALQRRLGLLRMWHNQFGLVKMRRESLEKWMYVRPADAPRPRSAAAALTSSWRAHTRGRGVDEASRRGPFGRLLQAVPYFLERELRNVRISDLFAKRSFVAVEELLRVRRPPHRRKPLMDPKHKLGFVLARGVIGVQEVKGTLVNPEVQAGFAMLGLPYALLARQYLLLAYIPVFVVESYIEVQAYNVKLFLERRQSTPQASEYLSLVELAPILEDFRSSLVIAHKSRRYYCVEALPAEHRVVRALALKTTRERTRKLTPRARPAAAAAAAALFSMPTHGV